MRLPNHWGYGADDVSVENWGGFPWHLRMSTRNEHLVIISLIALACCCDARAATYTVGPPGSGKDFSSLATLFSQVNLEPGDIVTVDGDATYLSSGAVGFKLDSADDGAPGNPVRITGRMINGRRPTLSMSQGDHVLKIERANHVVIEGFEITSGGGGSRSCVFSEAHDVVLRDLIIRDCKAHGVLAADRNSGSLTIEFSEIYNAGSGELRHPVYVTSDASLYPQAAFRMQFNYVHDGNGGNLLKSRHHRNEIYYNWFENSRYQEIELIGPDCEAWGGQPPAIEGNSDLVGNVVIHRNGWANVIRAGGDLNGRSAGRVRMVNNTILIDRPGGATGVLVQLGLKALEMHNTLVYQPGGSPTLVRENTTADTPACGVRDTRPWTDGVRRVSGTTNWVQSSASNVPPPAEWIGTIRGSDPGLVSSEIKPVRLRSDSPLRGAGSTTFVGAPGLPPFPNALSLPEFEPAYRIKLQASPSHRTWPSLPSIGAYEPETPTFIRVNGSMPLIPNQPNNLYLPIAISSPIPPLRRPNINWPSSTVTSLRSDTRIAKPVTRTSCNVRRSILTRLVEALGFKGTETRIQRNSSVGNACS